MSDRRNSPRPGDAARAGRPLRIVALLAMLLTAAGAAAAARAASPELREQAFAALWNEDTPRAIELFRDYLAAPDAAADREARRGLALACSWDGRQGEAAGHYRSLLADDPADGESRVGLGLSLSSWRRNLLFAQWSQDSQAASRCPPR